jgi:demethylmenaquinone methyltransferase/2-methoxy-6-polyprenyl-1,4-benzoquinol methylase
MSKMQAPVDRELLAGQIWYYRDRAAEYDQWWFRTGRFDRGAELNASWLADVRAVEVALGAFLDATRPRTILELACGTGLQTRHLAANGAQVTAVDASPEAIAINRARVGRANVDYVEADLFAWTPPARYDLVFMSFWLSHVPDACFDPLWTTVRDALSPGGHAYVIDSAHDPMSTARDHPPPDATAGVVTRKLNDGRTYRIVKVFHEPGALNTRLAGLGFDAAIGRTSRYFIHGAVRARNPPEQVERPADYSFE